VRDNPLACDGRARRNINRSTGELAHIAQDFAQGRILSRDCQQPTLIADFRWRWRNLVHWQLTQRTARQWRKHEWLLGLMVGLVVPGNGRRGGGGSCLRKSSLSESCQQYPQTNPSASAQHQNLPICASGYRFPEPLRPA